MFQLILIIHISLCVGLVGLVLVQQGKGADMGATFGRGGSDTMFGAAGATSFVSKLTTSIAIAFMVTSILLAKTYLNAPQAANAAVDPLKGSVMEGVAAPSKKNDDKADTAPASTVPVVDAAAKASAEPAKLVPLKNTSAKTEKLPETNAKQAVK